MLRKVNEWGLRAYCFADALLKVVNFKNVGLERWVKIL